MIRCRASSIVWVLGSATKLRQLRKMQTSEDVTLSNKLRGLQEIEKNIHQTVDLRSRIDITVSPTARGASFPYQAYTPFCQQLSKQQLLEDLGILDAKTNSLVNESCDVSSSKDGVCVVTRTILLSNTHAGTHCDQPGHFVPNPSVRFYDDAQYNGPCVVLDLSEQLTKTKTITKEMLETSLQGHNLVQCTRVLCCTKTANLEQWTNDFAHFNKESAEWICKNLPNLVLIGIDTPSVDSPNVAPIIASSHGQFWDHRVAIAENITFNRSQSIPQQAFLQTIWNPLQEADDARGCTMHLFNKM